MHAFLALDQSTSATKALLFDDAGKVLDRASLDHEQIYPQPGWVEHDAEVIWENTLSVLRKVALGEAAKKCELVCLSLTNQRETVVVFEAATGKPLANAMVWQCRRGVPLCEEHEKAGHGDLVRQRTGLKLDTYFSAPKLQHLVRNNKALAARLANGEALVGTIDTYLIYRLTGGAVFATDHTNACRTLLYDIHKLDWDEELCALWEIPSRALAEPRDSTAGFGNTDLEGALDRPLPIIGVMGDSHASLFAHRCFQPGTAKVTFGTGSSIMMNIGDQPKDAASGVVTTLAWVHDGKPVYAFEGIIISSAATLSWIRSQLGLIASFEESEALATEIDSTGGVYFVPAFSGLGLPYWDANARAAILGLSGGSDKRHIVRAGLEAIAYQVMDAMEAMRKDAGVPLVSLHGDGGATKNRFLMQFTSDMTGVDLRVSTVADCSPLGATLAGMLGRKYCSSLDKLAALPREEILYTPSMPEQLHRELAGGWHRAVQQVLSR